MSRDDEDTPPELEEDEARQALEDEDQADLEADLELARGETSPRTAFPAWRTLFVALIPLVVIFLGAGRDLRSLSVALGLSGLCLLVAPPGRRVPRSWLLVLGGMLLAPLLVFLPAEPLNALAPWRARLVEEFGIRLSDRVAPQTGVVTEAWVLMACGVLWLLVCLGQRRGEDGRRLTVRVLALGSSAIALLAMLDYQKIIQIPLWPPCGKTSIETFGPFVDRNNASSFCAIASILCAAAAYDAYRRRSRTWALFAPAFLVPVMAILVNTSRAGLLLFFAGMTAWLGTSAMRKGFFRKTAVSSSVVILLAAVLMIMGGGLSSKIASTVASGTGPGRLEIFQDTLKMFMQAPWMGVGLGNYEPVFAQITSIAEPRVVFKHPENDLLWLLAEGGLLTVLPCATFIVMILRGTGPWKRRKSRATNGRADRRLRNSAAICACIALAHGMVDVPNHGVGYVMTTCLLLGIAVRPRWLRQSTGQMEIWAFRLAGLAVIAAGALVWQAQAGKVDLPGVIGSQLLARRAEQLIESQAAADGLKLLDKAIAQSPMLGTLYFRRAQAKLILGRSSIDALTDFSRCRELYPHYARICFDEGVFWISFDPTMAVIPWREFLVRNPASGPGVHGHYRRMLNYAVPFPELRQQLWMLATTPVLKLDFMDSAQPGQEFNDCLQALLTQQPNLEGLDPERRWQLFVLWRSRGNIADLVKLLEDVPQLQDQGWRILAEEYARRSDFKKAYEMAASYLPTPPRPQSITASALAQLERAFVFNPTDVLKGVELYYAQRAKGDLNSALRTLEKVDRLPDAPAFLKRETASLHAQKSDYRRAWELIQAEVLQF